MAKVAIKSRFTPRKIKEREKKAKEILEEKMYFLVLYSLSPMQKGIQALHVVVEFSKMYPNKRYKKWADTDKSVIVLDGGTSNQSGKSFYSNEPYVGSMDKAIQELRDNNINFSVFHEPDVNNAITAVCFLVDEKVWDKTKYPDPEVFGVPVSDVDASNYNSEQLFLKTFLKKFHLAR